MVRVEENKVTVIKNVITRAVHLFAVVDLNALNKISLPLKYFFELQVKHNLKLNNV